MDADAFVQAVRERLHPNPYAGLLQAGGRFGLILARARSRYAHDVLGVIALPEAGEAEGLVEQARADIAARFGSLCYRREIVLHLIVHGPIACWQDRIAQLAPDRFGFRGVMVQSVYLVDPATGAGHKSVSRWGPYRLAFGGQAAARQVIETVEPILAATAD